MKIKRYNQAKNTQGKKIKITMIYMLPMRCFAKNFIYII